MKPSIPHPRPGLAPGLKGHHALMSSAAVNATGDGLYIAASALFFTRGLHLSVAEVGLGLTCAGVFGLGAGVPLGRLSDRVGPKGVLITIELAQALAIAAFLFVGRSFPAFVIVASLCIAGRQGADAANGALVAGLNAEDPVHLRAVLQAINNAGISIGTLLAGLAIAVGTHLAYQSVMFGDAISFLLAAVLLTRVPRAARLDGERAQGQRAWRAVRDRPFVALTLTNCVMAIQYFVLAFAMPLWVINHTRAPHWLISPLLLTNTVLVVLLQVRLSRGSKTLTGAAGAMRRAGLALACATGLYACASGVSVALAILALAGAVLVHTFGELLQSGAAYGVSYGLASRTAIGEYMGVYGLGIGVCRAVAPGVLAATCLSHGRAGWLILGVAFAASGLITPLLVRWAEANRPVAALAAEAV